MSRGESDSRTDEADKNLSATMLRCSNEVMSFSLIDSSSTDPFFVCVHATCTGGGCWKGTPGKLYSDGFMDLEDVHKVGDARIIAFLGRT